MQPTTLALLILLLMRTSAVSMLGSVGSITEWLLLHIPLDAHALVWLRVLVLMLPHKRPATRSACNKLFLSPLPVGWPLERGWPQARPLQLRKMLSFVPTVRVALICMMVKMLACLMISHLPTSRVVLLYMRVQMQMCLPTSRVVLHNVVKLDAASPP